ncbi:AAA family ATPase [[Phormidium] sp. ETS-05]|uniref:AAA family ATPase n=1 Tax=[Phormidium] sp. ETS-05 TaxID=222819 RepID=UPI001E530E7F|nr:ATP-binding protein [[Phormidium] sp. ETS-05]
MDIKEILKLADALILAKTGKHLDYLQEAILRGTVQGQTYKQIAEETYMSEGHVKDVGSELWKIFSERLGIDITKSNFRAILNSDNIYNIYLPSICRDGITINNINIYPAAPANPPSNTPQETPKQLHLELGDAPEISNFYGRQLELATLQHWITDVCCRLITLLGISGMGKTALAIRLIESIKSPFDYIIYRRLRFSPTLEATLTNLLPIFSDKDPPQSQEAQLSQLLKYLRQYRCLILFDDVQMLFNSQQIAQPYKSGCENYQQFF